MSKLYAIGRGLLRFSTSAPVKHIRRPVLRAMAAGIGGMTAYSLMSPLALEALPSAPEIRMVQDPSTKQHLPEMIHVNCNGNIQTLHLVGLGVRAVTFLRMYVYVAGLYVGEQAEFPRTSSSQAESKSNQLETVVRHWVESGVPCAVRIMPVRGTDFAHLRDGLVRAVNTREKEARKADDEYMWPREAEVMLDKNLRDMKQLFPRTSVPKGHALDLIVFQEAGNHQAYNLTVAYNEKVLGNVQCALSEIQDTYKLFQLPVQLLLAYVSERPNISAALRTSIEAHLESRETA
ncbi:hypothetical protein MYAM1_002580 [Malassezia yamatoensis]|uniref:Chalcone isomerase domain-containing protein n=1 Tax=Malassezia yamatoensis TaxID=253288 RepID=A0AAJ5Z085_9BASI|nr:hypothetical protein MYAM1_002580 [Malassezia yamatoensis]